MTKTVLIYILLAISLSAHLTGAERGFAIIVDKESYTACKAEIDSYSIALQSRGFTPQIVARQWNDPQEIRGVLQEMYLNNSLEGALFVGQIPIPMIRDAQHFTSAFKMDQQMYPFIQSSVPSDRFYDDFNLKFDYIGRDTTNSLLYYYSLRWDSPQKISCDIYSGRLKPTLSGEDGYRQIREYFNKLLIEKESDNPLDVITTFTGEGSYSNSLTAWKEEGHTLREQFPAIFRNKNSVKFLLFNMYPYMKDIVTDELRREDMDLMIFHEHGMPDRQYLTSSPVSVGSSQYFDSAKRLFRNALRKESSQEKREDLKSAWERHYNIDSTWFTGAFDKEQMIKDSLDDISTGIVIEDLAVIKPNARMVIFDACYNGDFREQRYIAGDYIFAGGKTVTTFANSVNVLQDKSASDLLGMLGAGYNIGEWAKNINILESHIFGDPTFSFGGGSQYRVDLKSSDCDYWINVLNQVNHTDIKALALYKLFNLGFKEMPQLLLNLYGSSASYMLRLQIFHLLQHYKGEEFSRLLSISVNDPYEFIRRKSIHAMSRIGSENFIPYIANAYINDYLDERVHFNTVFAFDTMDPQKIEDEVMRQFEQNNTHYAKEFVIEKFKSTLESRRRIAQMSNAVADKEKSLKERISAVRMLRNNAYHHRVDEFLKVLADNQEDLTLRIALAEALGWFTLSYRRGDIIESCKAIASDEKSDRLLREQLLKTVNRIEVFMR